MGGRLGLHLAVNSPGLWNRIVIESASAGLESETEREQRRKQDAQTALSLEKNGLQCFLDTWYSQPLFATLKSDSVRFKKLMDRRCRANATELHRSLRKMSVGIQKPLWDQLPRLNIPTLFLAGAKDIKYSTLADRMARLCPHGKAAIIAGAGHNLHFDKPQEVAESVSEFLEARE